MARSTPGRLPRTNDRPAALARSVQGERFGQVDDGLVRMDGRRVSLSISDVTIHALRQLGTVPAHPSDGQLKGVPIGHARDIPDGGPDGVVLRHRGGSWNELRAFGVIVDQGVENLDHGARLCERGGPHIYALVVERPQGGKGSGFAGGHPDLSLLDDAAGDGAYKGVELLLAAAATNACHVRGQIGLADNARMYGVLEIVRTVGDPVGPAHDLAFGRTGSRARPRVVANAVERLSAQIQASQNDVRAPGPMLVTLGEEGVEGFLAGVAAGTVAAVVAKGDRFGQRGV